MNEDTMQEEYFLLPDYFTQGNTAQVNVFHYQTDVTSRNNRVRLSQHLICMVRQGHKHMQEGNGPIALHEGQLMLVHAGRKLMSETTTQNQVYESLLVFFSDAFLQGFCARHNIGTAARHQEAAQPTFEKDDYLRLAEQGLLTLCKQTTKNQQLIELKAEEVLLYLYTQHPNTFQQFCQQARRTDQFFDLKITVEQNLNNNLTVDELAFLACMSPSTFKRKFKAAYAVTPKQYFVEHRMQRAKQYLKSQKKVSDVALEVGYENVSSFSHEFKKHFGLSPSKYVMAELNV